MTVGGSPDWSWQGNRIVAVVGPSGLMNPIPNAGISSGSIYEWIRRDDLTWPSPNEIIEATDLTWNTNPAYSPDGSIIAFNVESDDPNGGDSMGNSNVELWIKHVGDTSAPIRLDAANQDTFLGNSWPKWSPVDGRGRMWLAFSSIRDYGHILTNSRTDTPRPQIWITAIQLNTPVGIDPSAPAFWLPFQSISSGNHIPYWAPYEKQ